MAITVEEAPSQPDSLPGPIFNETFQTATASSTSGSSFSCFDRLPPELRLMIWTHALQARQQILSVLVASPDPKSPLQWYRTKNELGNIISGDSYIVLLTNSQTRSPMFAVSTEARQVAHDFYHIQLPMGWKPGHGRTPLWLNADFDIIEINSVNTENVVSFLFDIRAYDRKGIGLRHLALGALVPETSCLPRNPQLHCAAALSGFEAAITSLKTVIFSWRQWPTERIDHKHTQARFIRSMPVWAGCVDFEHLEVDPRPVEKDLAQLWVRLDPTRLYHVWLEMLRLFNIGKSDVKASYKFLWAATVDGFASTWVTASSVRTLEDAKRCLSLEEQEWQRQVAPGGLYGPPSFTVHSSTDESVKDAPAPVVGFWIFPAETFGVEIGGMDTQSTSGDPTEVDWSMVQVKDLTAYKPQLGVPVLK